MRMLEAPRDISICEDDVIDTGSVIQGGCDLILLDRETGAIIAANERFFNAFEALTALEDVFTDQDCSEVKELIRNNQPCQARFYELTNGDVLWAEFFVTEKHVGVEFTSVDVDSKKLGHLHRRFAETMSYMDTRQEYVIGLPTIDPTSYLEGLVNDVRDLTGFDRAMIYRFDADMNGDIVAEACAENTQPKFFGLKFPSGDIPAPARRLFLKNRVRQIFDVAAEGVRIVPTNADSGTIIFDQSLTRFRNVAPIHSEYLTNMGVRASLVIAIVVGNRLWGLIACHHETGPRRLDPTTLTLCQVVSDLASNHIAVQLELQRSRASSRSRAQASQLLKAAMASDETTQFKDVVLPFAKQIQKLTKSDGFIYRGAATQLIFGEVPSQQTANLLHTTAQVWMDLHHRTWVATNDLNRFGTIDRKTCEGFGGMAAFRMADKGSSLQFFRKSSPKMINWAGNPDAKLESAADPARPLTPRGSFKAYTVKTDGYSVEWQEAEQQAGREFHRCLHDAEAAFLQRETEHKLTNANRRVRAALARANFQAMHDPLTGLPNRRGFESFMSTRLNGEASVRPGWLCHIDVDRFKNINDTYGHAAGDEVLLHLAQTMSRLLPRGGHAARIGGDEFSIVLPSTYDEDTAQAFCESLGNAISCSVFYQGREINTSCTVGVTGFDAADKSLRAILARSDLALYRGKAHERGSISIFSPELENAAIARRKMEREIEKGLEDQSFVPFFQPQIDSQSEKIVGLEVLARWLHPERGTLLPADFFETAQQMNAMREIDGMLFSQAISTQRAWSGLLGRDIVLSLNISVERLTDPKLYSELNDLGDASKLLTLELLETIYLDDTAQNFDSVVNRLRSTGVGIEVDDFGSGRTSILAVASLRPDRLKIDRRLVEPVPHQKKARDLLKTILQIGEHLGISSVAEGVETAEHAEILRDLGCERLQGYHLGHPMDVNRMSKHLVEVS